MTPPQPDPPAGPHVLVLGLTGAYTPLSAYVQPFVRRGCAVTWVTEPAGAAPLARAGCDTLAYDGDVPRDGDLTRAGDGGLSLLSTLDQPHAARPIRAVVSYVEEWVPAAAQLARRYGVAHANSPETARLTTDKYAMRGALAAAGLPVPRYRLVRTVGEALDAARGVGLPCVLKPRRGSASRGVLKARLLAPVGRRVCPRESGTERIGYVVGRHADPRLLVESLAAAARDLAGHALVPGGVELDDVPAVRRH